MADSDLLATSTWRKEDIIKKLISDLCTSQHRPAHYKKTLFLKTLFLTCVHKSVTTSSDCGRSLNEKGFFWTGSKDTSGPQTGSKETKRQAAPEVKGNSPLTSDFLEITPVYIDKYLVKNINSKTYITKLLGYIGCQ
jgi:hypothetical protein